MRQRSGGQLRHTSRTGQGRSERESTASLHTPGPPARIPRFCVRPAAAYQSAYQSDRLARAKPERQRTSHALLRVAAGRAGCRWHGRGQGFESPKLHHCRLTRTLAMCDAVEQDGTGTYPSSGVLCGAAFRWYPVRSRVHQSRPAIAGSHNAGAPRPPHPRFGCRARRRHGLAGGTKELPVLPAVALDLGER
jgi:hypothetical protein